MSSTPLSSLLGLAASAAKDLEDLYAVRDLTFPSLASVNPTDPAELLLLSPEAQAASKQIISACGMIMSMVTPPSLILLNETMHYNILASLWTMVESNTVEIIRELGGSGNAGVHVDKIAAMNGMDSSKLARILRLLATHHIFTETSPNTFANNRTSIHLDSSSPVQGLLDKTAPKFEGTGVEAAMIGHGGDEGIRIASHMSQTLRSPETACAFEPNKTSFNTAFGGDLSLWEWYNLPENSERRVRFGNAMKSLGRSEDAPGKGFEWSRLPNGATIVDVGGNVGSACVPLLEHIPHLNLVIQDLPPLIEEGRKFWAEKNPKALKSGQVKLQVHDFFEAQPVVGADVYHLRAILHDWADPLAIKILRNIRHAATSTSKLVIRDQLIAYACDAPPSAIPGAQIDPAPTPLLPNWGLASSTNYIFDIHMLTCCNGKERTLDDWISLFDQSGWKLVRVYRGPLFAELVGELKGSKKRKLETPEGSPRPRKLGTQINRSDGVIAERVSNV
ncbi:hypothetical protein BOTBODRAFT_164961 [Botryobasidium botryosum FD-172 SS1]|uniref:O-methyltransferase C-terminal domain-containing protein n=1 Tax=Botryobasidium botryosum (strain FD-172 SS1) TaxID=930990 RepID=A0A067M0N6_BOTB1|nr:hypothetical protein BOTBODRAFT_164961 [Botryobasidium botryosum FD-172 SS1]